MKFETNFFDKFINIFKKMVKGIDFILFFQNVSKIPPKISKKGMNNFYIQPKYVHTHTQGN